MNNTGLPPLPPIGAAGPDVCAVIRLYLAVADDVSPEQSRLLNAHVLYCADCTLEQRVLQRSAQFVASMDASAPSARVDQAVMAAIAARQGKKGASVRTAPFSAAPRRRPRRAPVRIIASLAAAAVVLLALSFSTYFFLGQTQQQSFALPANLSWNAYVLYHTQKMTSPEGNYKVVSYDNMAANITNVTTTMKGQMDVVVVQTPQQTLGLDMMHHVAQWGVKDWTVDDSLFDVATLRQDLKDGHAVYQGKSQFDGQAVYRIRYANGDVLLLDMNYMPVNVLQNGKEVYTTLKWIPASQVSSSLWQQQVPAGFTMGEIPTSL